MPSVGVEHNIAYQVVQLTTAITALLEYCTVCILDCYISLGIYVYIVGKMIKECKFMLKSVRSVCNNQYMMTEL